MKLNSSDIHELLKQGENSSVEFKSSDVRPESIAREMVAFSNSQGGYILLGVEDDGTITGIESLRKKKNVEEWIINISRQNVHPQVQIEYQEFEWNNKWIGVVSIPKGKDKPYQTIDGKFYIRVGSTNRLASIQELLRLFQQSGIYHYDSTCVEGSNINSLNFPKISKYFETYKVSFEALTDEEKVFLLKNSDILCENENVTVAGLLIFGIQPQKYLNMASISFASFQGSDINSEILNKQNIEGTLDYQIDTTVSLILNSIPNPSTIQGVKRVPLNSRYPEKVYRELIVNACCHRNYSILGSKIRVFVFSNRLEVISPGRLPNTVTVEKLIAGVSYAVNPIIVKFMENLNYIDKLGRGLPMVYLEAKNIGKSVTFQELGEEFKVVLDL